jgi:hypothetical protein
VFEGAFFTLDPGRFFLDPRFPHASKQVSPPKNVEKAENNLVVVKVYYSYDLILHENGRFILPFTILCRILYPG